MLHATLDLARRVDRAEIDFCALASRAGEPGGAASIEAAGGRGLYAAHGSPLNKVLGLGLGEPVADADLDAIEAFYDERGVPVQIELCPLAVADLPGRLSARGYRLQGFENQLARVLGRERFAEPDGLRVTRAGDRESESIWLRVVAEGFATAEGAASGASQLPDPEVVGRLREVMSCFAHPELDRLIAWIGDDAAGTACSYVIDGTIGVTGTATLPAFRRRGVQHAVVARALNSAIGRADLAMATTEPGSTSQRTFERLGFQVIYTRAVFVLS